MSTNFRNRIIALLLSFLMLWPGIASAAMWASFTVTVNGKTQTYQMPTKLRDGTKLYTAKIRLKLVNRDGKWILEQVRPVDEAPKVEIKPNPSKSEKPLPPKEEKPTLPKETPKEQEQEDTKAGDLTADEAKMVELVNQERKKASLPALKVDMKLVELARKKSRDMVDNKYFSHTSPTYGSPFDMMKAAGVSYTYAGENLAGASKVDTAHENLMNSPGHRANILNSNFDHIGIGIVEGSAYGKIYTQMFIGKE